MAPSISHQSMRWRMDHTERLSWEASAVMGLAVGGLWAGWWAIHRVMMSILERGEIDPRFETLLFVSCAVGVVAQVAVAGTVRRWNWTEIHADPHQFVLRGPLRIRRWTWRQIRRFRTTANALVVETDTGSITLDRGSAPQSLIEQVALWLEAGRANGFEPLPVPPAPAELARLRASART